MSSGVQLLGFLMCLGGLLLTLVSLFAESWRTSTFANDAITTIWYKINLWQSCSEASTGIKNCRPFMSLLELDGYIQACRALMIISLLLGLLGAIMGVMGLACTKLGSTSEESKGKISLTAGIISILSGLCVIIAVSWYAARIVQEFYDPRYMGTKYELGVGLYLGWAGGSLTILGGGIFCTSFKSSRPAKSGNYNYTASQPQKIYKSPPSENSTSKAYV